MAKKKPKSLHIKRQGNKLICSWSLGESKGYSKQQFEWGHTKKYGNTFNVAGKAKDFTIQWNPGASLKKLYCRVRGYKGGWTDWTTASYDPKAPNAPVVKVEYNNDMADPRTVLSWEVKAENDKPQWFFRVGYQTRLVNNHGSANEEWSSIVYGPNNQASGSFTMQEDSTIIYDKANNASFRREFKLWAYGPGGTTRGKTSDGKTTPSYTYAYPNIPVISDEDQNQHACDLTPNGRGGYLCEVEWDSHTDSNHPIDSQEVQYVIIQPALEDVQTDQGIEKKITTPSGDIGWQTAGVLYPPLEDYVKNNVTYKEKKSKKKRKRRLKRTKVKVKKKVEEVTIERDDRSVDALDFTIDQKLGENQVVFIRILIKRGPKALETASQPYLCDDNMSLYTLSKPNGLEVTPSQDGRNLVTVSAQNACQIPDSFLIVSFCKGGEGNANEAVDIGYLTSKTGWSDTFEIPNDSVNGVYSIGVRAAIGMILPTASRDTALKYDYYANVLDSNVFIESETEWFDGSEMPIPPVIESLDHQELGNIHVKWTWNWKKAETAELSWSDYANAWRSTTEPSYYTVSNLYNGEWDIVGLELGKTYYVRIRLKRTYKDTEMVSRWSEQKSIFLSSAPAVPKLELSPSFINPGGTFVANWVYVSTDNTIQKQANLYFKDSNGKDVNLGQAGAEQTLRIDTSQHNEAKQWAAGSKKQITVVVTSESNTSSTPSVAAQLSIVAPPKCKIDSTNLLSSESRQMDVYREDTDEKNIEKQTITFHDVLKQLPLTIKVSGAGNNGTTSILIKRLGRFLQEGPTEDVFHGYDGEIVYSDSHVGEGEFNINRGDSNFYGSLDDGATYSIVATIRDEYEQTDEDEKTFFVNWTHKATEPRAALEYVNDTFGNVGAKINITSSAGYEKGDVIDIYRLSVDKPQLIYSGGDFRKANGEFQSYIDPYPTIGNFGGYRIVYRTYNDDFMTEDTEAFWDMNYENNYPMYDIGHSIISFENYNIQLEYDVNLSNSWSKDFTETKYLGGSIQGDWNPAVSRTGSISANVITSNVETIRALRRLATYADVCHVRSIDGSNYKANVTVNESIPSQQHYDPDGKIVKVASYTLNITRVDSDYMDVMTYDEWIDSQSQEE